MDAVAPVPQNLSDLHGTGGVGGVDVDDADVERAILEGGPFQHLHNRPDRVVLAEVMVQPQLVEPSTSVPIEEVDASRARPGYLRPAAIYEGTEIVNQNDAGLAGIHLRIMHGLAVIRRLEFDPGSAWDASWFTAVGSPR